MSTMPEFVKGYIIVGPTGIVQWGTNSDTPEQTIELFCKSAGISERKWLKLEDQGYRCAPVSIRVEPAGCGQ